MNKPAESYLSIAMRPAILKRSIIVAIIVGTILNLINQVDVLMGSTAFNLLKCLLTNLVPFCVSTYGSVTAIREMEMEMQRTTDSLSS